MPSLRWFIPAVKEHLTNELPNPKQALRMSVFSRDSLQPESPGSASRDINNTREGCLRM